MPVQLPYDIIHHVARYFNPSAEIASSRDALFHGRTPHFDIVRASLVCKEWHQVFAPINKQFYLDDGDFKRRIEFLHKCIRDPDSVKDITAVSICHVQTNERAKYEVGEEVVAAAKRISEDEDWMGAFTSEAALRGRDGDVHLSAIIALTIALLRNVHTLQLRCPAEKESRINHENEDLVRTGMSPHQWVFKLLDLNTRSEERMLGKVRRLSISCADPSLGSETFDGDAAMWLYCLTQLQSLELSGMFAHDYCHQLSHLQAFQERPPAFSKALRHLKVKIAENFTDFTGYNLGMGIFNHLQSLHLQVFQAEESLIPLIVPSLSKCSNALETLVLDFTEFVDIMTMKTLEQDSLATIGSFKDFTKLKHLEVSRQLILGSPERPDIDDGVREDERQAWMNMMAELPEDFEIDVTPGAIGSDSQGAVLEASVDIFPEQLEKLILLKPFYTKHAPADDWWATFMNTKAMRLPLLREARVVERNWSHGFQFRLREGLDYQMQLRVLERHNRRRRLLQQQINNPSTT